MNEPTLELSLTRDECAYVSDAISINDRVDQEHPLVAERLILKVAVVFMELVTEGSTQNNSSSLWITEAEAWLLREKTKTDIKTSLEQRMGIILLRKLYATLLQFDAKTTGAIVTERDMAEAAKERGKFATWREINARAESNKDNANDGAGDATGAPA